MGKRSNRKAAKQQPAPDTAAAPAPARAPRWKTPLAALLIGIGLFQLVSMPKLLYPGDNFTIRAEAAEWLDTGTLGIPYARKAELGGFLDQRGQYFFENDEKELLFSKYAIGNTLLFLPPVLAETLYSGSGPGMHTSDSQLVFLNLYNILFAVITALYLYRLAALYVTRRSSVAAFVLLSIYATFLWHYLRSPTTEIYHVCIFTVSVFHGLRFVRGLSRDELDRRAWRDLAAAATSAGFLVIVKHSFAVLLAVLWAYAFLAGPRREKLIARPFGNLRRHWPLYAWCLLLPSVVFSLAFLLTNWYRCGSPLESGYGQWISTGSGLPVAHLTLKSFPKAFASFAWRPGNYNVFLHYPVLVFALFAVPAFVRRGRAEAAFAYTVALSQFLLICFVSNWNAEWCYGPRLQIHALMLASVPFVLFIDDWILTGRLGRRLAAGAAVFIVAAWSLIMQINMNSLPYFTYHQVRGFLQDAVGKSVMQQVLAQTPSVSRARVEESLKGKRREIGEYFQGAFHRGLIHGDVIAYRMHGKPFPPLEPLEEMAPPQQRGWTAQLRPQLMQMTRWNYYLSE